MNGETTITPETIIETAYGAEALAGEVYATTTTTRYNAAGVPPTNTQKQLISQSSATLAQKSHICPK